jgi:hypothetical protein
MNRIAELELPIIHPTDDKFSFIRAEEGVVTLCNPILRTLTDACLWAEAELKGSFVIPTVEANPRYGDGVWEYLVRRA